jgi:hypothetical protein
MNSAPAVLRMPRIEIESIKCEPSSEEELLNKSYPWAACTPEPSPRYWGGAPDVPVKPMLSVELLRMVCEPCLEQISCIAQQAQVDANVSPQLLRSMCEPSFEQVINVLQQMTMASNELLRSVCEPFFQQMITSLQQTLLQSSSQAHFNDQCQSMHIMGQSANGMCCYQPVFYTHHVDEVSTDADDSPTSLFSGPSSEGEGVDATNKAEDSESQSDVERSIMVCRHWKSKGWCRLESKCKFLHPEHKCGICAPKVSSGNRNFAIVDTIGAEDGVPAAPAVRRRKRADRNRCTREHEAQLVSA